MILAAINWHTFFFLLTSLVACAFALGVLFSSNIVRMAFYLVVSLAATAGLFFLAGAHFVGAMQIMIYVGGTLVLLVFGVMLTAQSAFISLKTRGGEWILAAIVGGSLLFMLLKVAVSVDSWRIPRADQAGLTAAEAELAAPLGLGLIGVRVDRLDEPDPVLRRGMSGYLLALEVIGVHLLVVLIGAAYLARAKRRVARGP